MNDDSVGAGSNPSSDFDLDSFLKENNFLKEDGSTNTKPTGEDSPDSGGSSDGEKLSTGADTGSNKKTAGASAKTQSTRKTRPRTDPNATMSYEALGEDYPEIPFVDGGDAKGSAKGSSRATNNRSKATGHPVSGGSGGSGGTGGSSGPGGSGSSGSSGGSGGSGGSGSSGTDAATNESPAAQGSPATASKGRGRSATAAGKSATGQSTAAQKPRTSTTTATKKQTGTAANTGAGASTQTGARATNKARKAVAREPRLATLANPDDFRGAVLDDNNYRIRGGGKRHNRRSPVMVTLIAVVIIAAVGLAGYFLNNLYHTLMDEKTDAGVVTLTANDTRQAIDAEMPRLLNYVGGNTDEVFAEFRETNGWNVSINDRATSDNPDRSSTGNEIIHLGSGISEDTLKGYYESEFNAYSFDELQQNFNGAWMLDLSRGDQGGYAQLKYVNFASSSLEDEIKHLRELQGLAEGESVVDSEGEDDWGNTYVQGYTVIGETTYYWKVIGIAFGDYYRGQDKRKLPATTVFVKCTVASFDFYGVKPPEQVTEENTSGGGTDTGGGEGGEGASDENATEENATDENAADETT